MLLERLKAIAIELEKCLHSNNDVDNELKDELKAMGFDVTQTLPTLAGEVAKALDRTTRFNRLTDKP